MLLLGCRSVVTQKCIKVREALKRTLLVKLNQFLSSKESKVRPLKKYFLCAFPKTLRNIKIISAGRGGRLEASVVRTLFFSAFP